jgi:tetratricopeptide (TPR) repeat protein
VTGPLTRSRFSFAPGVAEKVVQDLLQVNVGNKTHAMRGDYVEPVQLQVVCDALCRHLPPNVSVITLDHLQDFGNVDEALANFYKECLKETTRATHVWGGRLRRWFGRTLITPEGVRDTVRQGPTETGGLPNRAVRKLEELHLIRGEERPGRGRWYELTHDTFIHPIQEVNRIADRRVHWLEGVVACVGVIALGAAIGWLIYLKQQSSQRKSFYNTALANGYQSIQDWRYEDAVKQFERALQIHPENRRAHVMAARSHSVLLGHDEQAVWHYHKALEHYHKALEIKPKLFTYVEVSSTYLAKAKDPEAPDADVSFDEAEAEVNEAAKLYPTSPLPDIVRGDIEVGREEKRKGGKYSDAEKCYVTAIKKDPKSQDAYRGLADVHLRRDEVDDAINYAWEAVKLAPTLASPHATLGREYFWKGNYYEAAAELGRAIGLNSNDYVSHCFLGEIYYRKEKYELAEIELDDACQLAGSMNDSIWKAQASAGLGGIALKQRKWAEADGHFDDALAWDPKGDYAYFVRGLLFNLKEPERAKADWEQALKLCDGPSFSEKMKRVIYNVALGVPNSAGKMNSIITEHSPIGMMEGALDDADLLVTFRINLPESQKLRDTLVKTIEEAHKQPAKQE